MESKAPEEFKRRRELPSETDVKILRRLQEKNILTGGCVKRREEEVAIKYRHKSHRDGFSISPITGDRVEGF